MALIKQSDKVTNYVLPVFISTGKGYLKRNRYYDCEYDLWRAYYQLKKIKTKIIPSYPVIYYWKGVKKCKDLY